LRRNVFNRLKLKGRAVTAATPSTSPTEAALTRVTAPGLPALRASIDRADRAVAELLVRRARAARRVALLKRLMGLPPRDQRREQEVLQHYAAVLRPAGWGEQSLDTWLVTMLSASRDVQAHLRVAIQGGPGSWSEEALHTILPAVDVAHCDTVDDAWRRSLANEDVAAFLPVHNTTVGAVPETAHLARDAETWAQVDQPVQHALLAPVDLSLDRVDRIEAHPLALAQCRETLDRLLPGVPRAASVDGAYSAARLEADSRTAVLASPRLARRLPLRVLHAPVNDRPDNRTTFHLFLPKQTF
jgi:chorismate mutase / prephenate dehydratase